MEYVQANMRRQIAAETWEQIKTAFASGLGLRELARNMDIPEGTVLGRQATQARCPTTCASRDRDLRINRSPRHAEQELLS